MIDFANVTDVTIPEGNVDSIYEYYTYINSNEDVRNAARKIWPNTGGGGDAPTPSVSNDFYIEFNGNKLDESSSMVGYTSANLLYYKGSAENVCVNSFYIPMNDYFPTTPFLFRKKDSNSYIPYTDIEIYIGSLPGIGVPLSYSYTGDGKSIVFNLLVSNSSFYLPNLSYGRVYSYIKFRQKSTGASKVWVTIFYKSSLYRTIMSSSIFKSLSTSSDLQAEEVSVVKDVFTNGLSTKGFNNAYSNL